MTDPIRFVDLMAQQERIGPRIRERMDVVLAHGAFIMGPEVGELEAELARRAGVAHVVSCGSGTDALLLALMAFEIGRGDAVIVPTFTFAATAEVVALTGATPVFVDSDDSFNVDPDLLEDAHATAERAGLRPRAVIAVDLFGLPADYDRVEKFASDNGMWVLSDAAQSFGSTYHGRPGGALGTIAATSFFPAKPLGCYGDGGAVFTDDEEVASVLRSLRVHGQGASKYENVRIGINGRLDTLQAAILLAKLEVFDDELGERQQVAARYSAGLADIEAVRVPEEPEGCQSAWAQYTIRVPDRDAVAESLRREGVPTAVYYPEPLHWQPAYQGFPVGDRGCPVAEVFSGDVLSLPLHPYLEGDEQGRIIESVRRHAS